MLENEGSLHVSDDPVAGECLDAQGPEVRDVTNGDMHEEIHDSTDMVDVDHLGMGAQPRVEGFDVLFQVVCQTDRDNGLDPDPECRGSNISMEPSHVAFGLKPTNAMEAGRRGEADLPCEFLVGESRIPLQECQDRPIGLVKH
jgi:hypothetical protein